MHRFAAVLGLLGASLAALVGLFVASRVRDAGLRQEALHLEVADRIFTECERRLTQLLSEEERRPFDHYRYFYVPDDLAPGSVALNRSPLAEEPAAPFIQGYFQLAPDGTYNNPQRPGNDDLARAGFGWRVDRRVEEFDRNLRELLGAPAGAGGADADAQGAEPEAAARDPKPIPEQRAAVEQGQTYVLRDTDVGQSLVPIQDDEVRNDYARNRSGSQISGIYDRRSQPRAMQRKSVPSAKADRFLNPQANVVDQNLDARQQRSTPDAERDDRVRAEAADAGTDPYRDELIQEELALVRDHGVREAVMHPFAPRPLDADRLALVRRVEIDGRIFRQGFVVAFPALAEELEDEVLADRPLRRRLDLHWRWDGTAVPAPAEDKAYRFVHVFARPFAALNLYCDLPVLADRRVPGLGLVGWLSIGLGAAILAGFVAVYRMAATRVEFARRRSDFVSAVTHELKTPLTSIRMYGEMLAEDMVPDEESRRRYYRTITAEGERLGHLVDNVLELSKLEHGTRDLRPEVGDPRRVVDRLLEMMGPHARELGFDLRLEEGGALPAACFDGEALLQVLLNLVDNALKFSRDADAKEVVLGLDAGPGGYRLRVRDHGPGVPEPQLRRIFEPFYRGEREATRRTKGTGIGLALVRGLVERMGGRLRARNHPDGGLEVLIDLAAA